MLHRISLRYLVLAACVLLCAATAPLFAAVNRSPENRVAKGATLVVDGKPLGMLEAVSGGAISADVITEKLGLDHLQKKHLAGVKYEDLALALGFGLDPSVYQWISSSWKAAYTRKNGGLIIGKTGLQFYDALLTETTIPACDVSARLPAFLTVKLAPKYTRDGAPMSRTIFAAPVATQQVWAPANFRLEIDGLDGSGVLKIDPLTVKMKISENAVGDQRDYEKEPAVVEFPNLHILLAETKAASWKAWHDDFVIKGNNSDDREKTGRLILLAPDNVTEIMRINLFHLGISKLERAVDGQVWTELYCERMELDTSKTGTASTTTPTTPPATTSPAETVYPPDGPGKFGETYRMRESDPLNFTLKSANFTVAAVNAGEFGVAPAAREKLLVLHFSVGNPQATERLVRHDMLRLSTLDAAGLNYPSKTWGVDATGKPAALNLTPGTTVDLYTMLVIPAKGEPATIMVKSNRDNDGPDLVYTVHGQVPALPAPFADPADATGATALEEVAAAKGAAYPCDHFTVSMEKIASVTTPLGEVTLKEGERFLVCTLLVKNQFPVDCQLRRDMLQPELIGSEGEQMLYRGMLLETTDRPVAQLVHPGAEMRVRIFFTVPKGARAQQLIMRENKSRRYRYTVQ